MLLSNSEGSSTPAVTMTEKPAILRPHQRVEKEEPMKNRRRGRLEAEQTNLFQAARVTPDWKKIPIETRKEVKQLVARLLSAYQMRRALPPEVQDD